MASRYRVANGGIRRGVMAIVIAAAAVSVVVVPGQASATFKGSGCLDKDGVGFAGNDGKVYEYRRIGTDPKTGCGKYEVVRVR